MKETTLTLEECTSTLDALGKSISKAETTVAVLTKQMDTLKSRRKQIEDLCVKDLGVPVKELQQTAADKLKECAKYTNQAAVMFESITKEQGDDGSSD